MLLLTPFRFFSFLLGMMYSLYFIILVLFGNYTLLNVFLAIAVDNLANAQELTAAEAEEAEENKERAREELEEEIANLHKQGMEAEKGADGEGKEKSDNPEITVDVDDGDLPDLDLLDIPELQVCPPSPAKNDLERKASRKESMRKRRKAEEEKEEEEPEGPKPMLPYSSMFIFSSTNPIRCGAHYLVNMKYFDAFIMIVISLSSLALASEDPVNENSETNVLLNKLDYGFTAVFTVEFLLKIVDQGIILHPGSFGRDIWNVLDAIVVMCALIGFAFGDSAAGEKLSTIKSLRVLRVLRPLKTIKRVPKLKVCGCEGLNSRGMF